jgi:hypothetical protein
MIKEVLNASSVCGGGAQRFVQRSVRLTRGRAWQRTPHPALTLLFHAVANRALACPYMIQVKRRHHRAVEYLAME